MTKFDLYAEYFEKCITLRAFREALMFDSHALSKLEEELKEEYIKKGVKIK